MVTGDPTRSYEGPIWSYGWSTWLPSGEVILLLLNAGADTNAKNNRGLSALDKDWETGGSIHTIRSGPKP